MRDLKTFQEKVEAYRKNAATPHTQKELAEGIPLDKDEFSKRLNAYKHPNRIISPLTCAQVQAIVRVLARWGAIETQEQAKDLLDLMECPHFSVSDWKVYPLKLLESKPSPPSNIRSVLGDTHMQSNAERLARLRAMQVDHSGFLHNRLESFVGRQAELADLHRLINTSQPMGGYITITGRAGQGKSSIIAKLIEEYNPEKTTHHFIPFNPGPDYQVNLLRDVMARLIMKHGLSDLYVISESLPALRDYFPKVLAAITAKGKQEVIFIDGLDQLLEGQNGERDLSFLPNNTPDGVVFVLGTRPDDTLRPLELRKPHSMYDLPNMSRQDFDLLLERRGLRLDKVEVDQFYHAMHENALYLDLVAKELVQEGSAKPEEILRRVADNPENIFSLSIARLKRKPLEWREVLKPILGVLLVAREPLTMRHIRQILEKDDDRIRDDLARLGGLIADDGRGRFSLFHRKLYDYLRQDENNRHKDYLFATDEEQGWHKTLADWCGKDDIATIWEEANQSETEQGRREYARRHYVTHLYHAWEWPRLFALLDEGKYGQAKVRYDPSTRSYVQDLDLGRRAAAWERWSIEEALELLPRLWRYTLLRCSLTHRADQYPPEAFLLLTLLGRDNEAIGLVELLTNSAHQTHALLLIAKQIAQQVGRKQEGIQLLLRACEVGYSIKEHWEKDWLLQKLGTALASEQQWEQAEAVVHSIKKDFNRTRALIELGTALVHAQQWELARKVWINAETEARAITEAHSIESSNLRGQALIELGTALVHAHQFERARVLWNEAHTVICKIEKDSYQVMGLAKLAAALAQAQQWEQAQIIGAKAQALALTMKEDNERVSTEIHKRTHEIAFAFLLLAVYFIDTQQWEQAQLLANRIGPGSERAEALIKLGTALAEAQRLEQAQVIWNDAEIAVDDVAHQEEKVRMLAALGEALIRSQQWEQAQAMAKKIDPGEESSLLLTVLGTALAQAQQWEQAQKVWNDAKLAAYATEGIKERANALTVLGIALAQVQQWNQAQVVCNEVQTSLLAIEWSTKRSKAAREVAVSLAQVQQWEDAQTVVQTIEENYEKATALREMGTVFAQAQLWERAQVMWVKAQIVASTVEDDFKRAKALHELGTALVEAQQWEHAQVVASMIERSGEGAKLLRKLGTILAQAQQWEQAQAVISIIEDGYERNRALRELGAALAQAQQLERAQKIWEQAQAVISIIEDGYERNRALRELGAALAQAQQWEQAQKVWEEAQAMVSAINGSQSRAWALSWLGAALAQAQQWEQAQKVWEQAQAIAHTIKSSGLKAEVLSILVGVLAEAQQWEQAEIVWGEAQGAVQDIEHKSRQIWRPINTIWVLAQAQQWERAEFMARTIVDHDGREQQLSWLVAVLAHAEEWERADRLARSLEMSHWRATALTQLGSWLEYGQRWEQAQRVWAEAQAVASTIEENWRKAEVLSELGVALANARQWEQAEMVASVIEESEEDLIQKTAKKAEVLWKIAEVLSIDDKFLQLMHLVQRSWLQAETREYAIDLLSLATKLILCKPDIGTALYEAFAWVEMFLK